MTATQYREVQNQSQIELRHTFAVRMYRAQQNRMCWFALEAFTALMALETILIWKLVG